MSDKLLTIEEIKNLPIVFIVGKGRSGTSLLQTILDANPEVITANESPFIIHLKQKYSAVKKWTSEKLDEFIIDLYKDIRFSFLWKINANDLKRLFNSYPLCQLDFSVLCKLVYLSVSSPFPKGKTSLIVDKNPIYSFFINELIELFPNAKFIHIIRDYRDNVISTRKAFTIKNVARLAQSWKRHNKYIDYYKIKHPSRFYTLRYEDLVTNPEKSISELFEFLTISFDSNILYFHKTTRRIFNDERVNNDILTGIVDKIHVNLLNPINTERIDKWKNELTISEIEVIDYITGDYAKKYNYIRSTNVLRLSCFLSANKSNLILFTNYLINKLYYRLPIKMRDISRAISQKLYTKFGYFNKYNEIGAKYRKN